MSQEVNIKNGITGDLMKVDSNQRGHTAALTRTQQDEAHHFEFGHNYNTGIITLTGSETTSGVIYLKNNDDREFVLKLQLLHFGASTAGVGNFHVQSYKNIDDTSTIVSGALTPEMNGINYHTSGKDNPPSIACHKGVEGATIVGGIKTVASLLQDGTGADVIPLTQIVGSGENIAITVKTQNSNTSMEVMAVFAGYFEDEKVSID